ncbi:hypothetical protein CRX51_21005 [Pluralibacter gergoviae]|nr:hypothetical protein CRX51_21005 [Pluralibacter gergoviae]
MPDLHGKGKCKRGNIQPTKNPSTLNRIGGVDGLHKMGTSKKSSGITYDCLPERKFCLSHIFFCFSQS